MLNFLGSPSKAVIPEYNGTDKAAVINSLGHDVEVHEFLMTKGS